MGRMPRQRPKAGQKASVAFSRRKTVRREFWQVRLSEHDLYQLATEVQKLAGRFGGEIDIEVVSADGEDTIRTSSPAFMRGPDLPRAVRSVAISYRQYPAPLSCRLELPRYTGGPAMLEIEGNDPTAISGMFREFERTLAGC